MRIYICSIGQVVPSVCRGPSRTGNPGKPLGKWPRFPEPVDFNAVGPRFVVESHGIGQCRAVMRVLSVGNACGVQRKPILGVCVSDVVSEPVFGIVECPLVAFVVRVHHPSRQAAVSVYAPILVFYSE